MQSAILILKRSVSIPKHVWRLSSTRRTLDRLELDPLTRQALQPLNGGPSGPSAIIEADVAHDGAGLTVRTTREVKERDYAGVFALNNEGEEIKVSLDQEACRREVYTPRRSSQHITSLQAWEPVRIILNGKADWSSGRYYYIQDYHLILCKGEAPARLLPVRTFDFQADLI